MTNETRELDAQTKLRWLADDLERTPRQRLPHQGQENVLVIQVSDELASFFTTTLRVIADEIDTWDSRLEGYVDA